MISPKCPMPASGNRAEPDKAEILSEDELDRVQGGLKSAELSKTETDAAGRIANVAGTASGGGSR